MSNIENIMNNMVTTHDNIIAEYESKIENLNMLLLEKTREISELKDYIELLEMLTEEL